MPISGPPPGPRRSAASSSRKPRVAKMSNTLACSGTTTLSAILNTSAERQPCSPPGVSSTAWLAVRGGRVTSESLVSQVPIGRAVGGRRPSHSRDDCCRSTSPSRTSWPRLA
jgi:hypothetical protein